MVEGLTRSIHDVHVSYLSFKTFMCRLNNDYLELVKKPSAANATEALVTGETLKRTDYAKGFYDDGITYKWENGIKPRHIRFETMAGSSILD